MTRGSEPTAWDVVIIGAGFAGAATAYFLSRVAKLRILVVEQEPQFGRHSSGRNAGMIRSAVKDPDWSELAARGAEFFRHPPRDFAGGRVFEPCGSWFVVAEDQLSNECIDAPVEVQSVDRLVARFPFYRPPNHVVALANPQDGYLDIDRALGGYLESARQQGVVIKFGVTVQRIHWERQGLVGVLTNQGLQWARAVVNAAGAWAGALMQDSSALDPGFFPTRRHLVATAKWDVVEPTWPYVWDLVQDFYFRPYRGGLLLCACDEEKTAPGACIADERWVERTLEQARRVLPGVTDLEVASYWAGHRTYGPQRRPLLGADPKFRGLFWAAGLGGHGVTSSPAVGQDVAQSILRHLGMDVRVASGSHR